MSTRLLALGTVGAWAIAALAWPVPVAGTGVVAVAIWALAIRVGSARAVLVSALLAVAASASFHANRRVVIPERAVLDSVVTLTSDPESITRGVGFDIDWHGSTLRAYAFGSPAGHVRHLLRGERVHLTGTITPESDEDAKRWGRDGKVSVTAARTVRRGQHGAVHYRIANALRRTIESGAASLSRDQQSLLAGFVYGDDRAQSPLVADDFQAGGLTHLLAVSGSNVAFVLIIAGPMLRRFALRGRLVATFAVLFAFATLTRFEPSVMRASVMAAVATVAVTVGRPASGIRLLLVSVFVLVLAQPPMARSLAFQLSVLASAGILVIGPHLIDRVPGPRWWQEAIAVTTAAQLAVAPLLVATFDTVPVASLPANVAAGPAAGPIMMWGLTAGAVAGVVPAPVAAVLHIPTRWMIGWVQGAAHQATMVRLGDLGGLGIALLSSAVAVAVMARTRRRRRIALAAIAVCLLAPGSRLRAFPPSPITVEDHPIAWQDRDHTLVVLDGDDIADVLEALRFAGVSNIDALVLSRGSMSEWSQYRTLDRRYTIGEVWVPNHDIIGTATVPTTPLVLAIGSHRIVIDNHDGRLEARPVTAPAAGLTAPPR